MTDEIVFQIETHRRGRHAEPRPEVYTTAAARSRQNESAVARLRSPCVTLRLGIDIARLRKVGSLHVRMVCILATEPALCTTVSYFLRVYV